MHIRLSIVNIKIMDELSDIDIFDSTQLKNAKVKDVELTLGELGYAYSTTHKAH